MNIKHPTAYVATLPCEKLMCRIPGVQFHLSPKFAYKELVWDSFASSVGLSVRGFRSSVPKVKT